MAVPVKCPNPKCGHVWSVPEPGRAPPPHEIAEQTGEKKTLVFTCPKCGARGKKEFRA
jgi:hypothetical protein